MQKQPHKASKLRGIIIVGVVIIPLMYSLFYLGAFWDPYSRLNTLPVAVVNNDTGAEIDGVSRNLGDELCERLQEDGSLKFVFTDTQDAEEGTEGTDYYATLTIPEDFSSDIASAEDTTKHTASLQFTSNQKRNYLADQILTRAVLQIEETTRATVNSELTQRLADKLLSVPDQLNTLDDALLKLNDGSSELKDGTDQLADGADDLADGAETLADKESELADGAETVADGAGQLADGASQLESGTSTLASGTAAFTDKFSEYQTGVLSLSSGSEPLTAGASSLDSGIDELLSGADQLTSSTEDIDELSQGAATLAAKAEEFNEGMQLYTAGVDTLLSSIGTIKASLTNFVTNNPTVLLDSDFQTIYKTLTDENTQQSLTLLTQYNTTLKTASAQIAQYTAVLESGTANLPELKDALLQLQQGLETAKSGSSQLAAGTQTLSSGIQTVESATEQLSSAASTISAGASEVNGAAAQLSDGADTLSDGANAVSDGAAALSDGADTLSDGANTLKDGVSGLQDGAAQLNDGLNETKDGVEENLTDANEQVASLNGLSDYAEDPVDVEETPINTVPNYGTAFAPYFMSLSLWVGALIIFFGIFLDADGRFKILSRDSDRKVARSFAYLLIGFVQAIVLAIVLQVCLGLEVKHLILYYLSCCLVSMVDIAIIQFFLVYLKDAGKFLSLAMLILQLTSCGGTFPMETIPKFFNVLYPFMPMTYSVGLFKETISGDDSGTMLFNAGILFAILVVFMILTVTLGKIKRKRKENSIAVMA